MFQRLVSHNPDIEVLLSKGYALALDSGHLIIRDIPYLNGDSECALGAFAIPLEYLDAETVKPSNHQVWFAGGVPYELDGKPIKNLGGGLATLGLTEKCKDVVVQRTFSYKIKNGNALREYTGLKEQVESYISTISGPAITKFGVTPFTYNAAEDNDSDQLFYFQDTLTSRAQLYDLSLSFSNEVVAIIGLGGSGSYVLDFLVKSRVGKILGFDKDPFFVHNAFRAPGKVEADEFKKTKAEVYAERYKNFRKGLELKNLFVDKNSAEEFKGVTFAFVCVDKGSARSEIFDLLTSLHIPFIDVGMGIRRKTDSLSGLLRVSYYPAELAQQLIEKQYAPLTDPDDLEYKTNIQISELNALLACLAVIRYKQTKGFYLVEEPKYNLLFDYSDFTITREPIPN